MKNLANLVSALLGIAVVAGAWSAGLGAHSLYSAAAASRSLAGSEVVDVPLAGVPALRLRADGTTETIDLGSIREGVVFAFDASCGVCNLNMWNWIDVVRDASGAGAGRLYAISVMPPEEAWAYWDGMQDHLEVLVADPATLVERLEIPGPPATLLIEDGAIRHRYHGFLDTRAKAAVAAAAVGR